MKIAIITMEDPLYTTGFMEAIIRDRHKDIVGLTIAKGNRLKIGPKRSKTTYLFSLLLIMGIPSFTWYVTPRANALGLQLSQDLRQNKRI